MVFMEMSLWVVSAQLTKGGCAVISPFLIETAGVPSLKLPNTSTVPQAQLMSVTLPSTGSVLKKKTNN